MGLLVSQTTACHSKQKQRHPTETDDDREERALIKSQGAEKKVTGREGVKSRVPQERRKQTFLGVVEDPGDHDGDPDRAGDETQNRQKTTSCVAFKGSEKQGKMPAGPQQPQNKRTGQWTIALLQAGQGKAAPAGFFGQGTHQEGERKKSQKVTRLRLE